jgi:hypothetical protein
MYNLKSNEKNLIWLITGMLLQSAFCGGMLMLTTIDDLLYLCNKKYPYVSAIMAGTSLIFISLEFTVLERMIKEFEKGGS